MRNYRWLNLAIAFALSIWLSINLSQVLAANNYAEYDWGIPAWMPKPVVPKDNPLTISKVELGRHLFYEKQLSVTGNYACASCHKQSLAFTDGKVVGIGATDESHPRNSMSLANIGYNSVLTWANPLQTSLETQLLVPLFGEHPIEMGMAGKENQILDFLENNAFSKFSADINLKICWNLNSQSTAIAVTISQNTETPPHILMKIR